ncbi:transporter substrate-binding domain-containing protein [Helicobacter sp. 11S02629-2]|uniref:transporter substrate-binding domain-containing protein n=1 Tax=Helicobacter sp. 11S02629-2 TaxID=1476195 RepID=UPI000BA691A9|nr:transporter substrate-binding domain-containing protein [Helicobacter sp. 11S02629-2]PAF45763.1 hypothetical protein BKH40_02495 [Helicobacter sp. 11S02629-2]
MFKSAKKIVFALVVGAFLVACSSGSHEGKEKSVAIGVNATYPPFEYIEDAKYKGYDIDLMDEIAKRADFKFQWVNMSYDGLIPALKTGKVDLTISSMNITPDRLKSVDFSHPYFVDQNVFIKRKDSDDITTLESLKGKKIGSYLGTQQEERAMEVAKQVGGTEVSFKDVLGAVLSLNTNKIDAVVTDGATATNYLKQYPNLVRFYTENSAGEGFGIAADKGKHKELMERINKAIDSMKEDGTLESLAKKYGLK